MTIYPIRIAAVFTALATYMHMLPFGMINERQALVFLTLLLFWYLYVECRRLWRCENHLYWLNPVVLSSGFTFLFAFGVSNILYFMPESLVSQVGMEPVVTPAMVKLMFLVVLGAVSMWSGYDSFVGKNLARQLIEAPIFNRVILKSTDLNMGVFYLCLGVSALGRLLSIKLGLFGYSGDPDLVIAAGSYTMYLAKMQSLGKLALVGIGFKCFSVLHPTFRDRLLLGIVMAYEVFFGFLSGSKSPVVMPFLILGFVYYSQRFRFPKLMVPAVIGGLVIAYMVIEPFRVARTADAAFSGTSVESIASTMVSAHNQVGDIDIQMAPIWMQILSRINLTHIASLGIEYAATVKLHSESPNFLGDILLSPIHAIVPRFLWPSKPLGNLGVWYTHDVIGSNSASSTAMGPITYLNFAGGMLAVIIGFFVVGVTQRFFNDGLKNYSGGGLIVLLGLMPILANINSAFNGFFIDILREFPLLIVLQYFLLKSRDNATIQLLK